MRTLKETYGFISEGVAKTPLGPFKLGQFRTMKTLEERVQYLNTRTDVKFLSKGSSRAVYALAGGKAVVKLAMYQRGRAQNKVEYNSNTCPNAEEFVPKMFNKAPDYAWIIVEAIEQFPSAKAFEKATAVPLKYIEAGINFLHPDFQKNYRESSPTYKKYEQIYTVLSSKIPWYKKVVAMAAGCSLIPGDVAKYDSWGLTKRGRVVLLDPGVTDEVWNKYYEKYHR